MNTYHFKGISHTRVGCPGPSFPARYPYIYEVRPANTLYGPSISTKPFPMTNRPRTDYPVMLGYVPHVNILERCNLVQGEANINQWWTCEGPVYGN